VARDEELPRAELVPLAKPRPLAGMERALAEYLARGPLARPELDAQVDAAMVVGTCSCGCPSVALEVDPSVPEVTFAGEEVAGAPTGPVALSAYQESGDEASVKLHIVQGRLAELEIWAGFGVRPRIELANLKYV